MYDPIEITYEMKGEGNQWARIVFQVKNKMQLFHTCEYHTQLPQYCFEDWKFLGDVAQRIQDIEGESL